MVYTSQMHWRHLAALVVYAPARGPWTPKTTGVVEDKWSSSILRSMGSICEGDRPWISKIYFLY